MAAFDPATLDRWRALAIVDRDGTTVGTISEFYLDRETGHPTWALVNTGLFGATQTFVPLVHATEISDGLQVPYEKSHIKDTPRVDLHDELTPDEEAALFAHYGVDYQPSAGPLDESPEGGSQEPGVSAADSESGSLETGAVPPEPGSVEPGAVSGEPGSGSVGPGGVPAEPGSMEPGAVPAEPGSGSTGSADLGPVEAGAVPAEPGSVEGPGPVPADAGSLDQQDQPAGPAATEPTLNEPGTVATSEPRYGSGPGEPTSQVPDEPWTSEPGDATLVAPVGPGTASELEGDPADAPGDPRTDPGADPSQTSPPDPDLSRTAPAAPGLPGSTAAAPGPVPTTVDKEDAGWPPSFDDRGPADQPAGGASDRWREAKLAAERNRIARTAAAQPEERSPLERARRRLERLVGVGQDQDPDDISPAERDAAERARRARLGLEDDDPRRR